MNLFVFSLLTWTAWIANGANLRTPHVPKGWIFREFLHYGDRLDVQIESRAPPDTLHTVDFMVKFRHLAALSQRLEAVSDPAGPLYGQYWNRQEVATLVGNTGACDRVTAYLRRQGIEIVRTSVYNETITARAPLGRWEALFATEFFSFSHPDWARSLPRALHYSLPQSLHTDIDLVRHVVHFPFRSSGPPSGPRNTSSPGYVTPAFLRSHYNITTPIDDTGMGYGNVSQAVFSSLGQYISPGDLRRFQLAQHLPPQPLAGDIGAEQNRLQDAPCRTVSSDCAEGNLDAQYLLGITQTPTQIPNTSTQIPSSPPAGQGAGQGEGVPTYNLYYEENDFVSMLENVTARPRPPQVISISYGSYGVDNGYAQRFNVYAQMAGVMGISVVAASGDDGVNDPRARLFPFLCGYTPSFPAYSPYVLAVGATQGPERGGEEVGCASDSGGVITSGGGFSPYDPLPYWQRIPVTQYFARVNGTAQQPAPGYAVGNRGYPDIAALGVRYYTVLGGVAHYLYGTSASAPVLAGLLSLLNTARRYRQLPPLGFVNPLLYARARSGGQGGGGGSIVRDVTGGRNFCPAESWLSVCCDSGFYATPGWDPVTGLGVPDFHQLLLSVTQQ